MRGVAHRVDAVRIRHVVVGAVLRGPTARVGLEDMDQAGFVHRGVLVLDQHAVAVVVDVDAILALAAGRGSDAEPRVRCAVVSPVATVGPFEDVDAAAAGCRADLQRGAHNDRAAIGRDLDLPAEVLVGDAGGAVGGGDQLGIGRLDALGRAGRVVGRRVPGRGGCLRGDHGLAGGGVGGGAPAARGRGEDQHRARVGRVAGEAAAGGAVSVVLVGGADGQGGAVGRKLDRPAEVRILVGGDLAAVGVAVGVHAGAPGRR